MENEKGKLKRFQVTHSVRFTSNTSKILYFFAIAVELAAILTIGFCVISHTQKFLGVAVVFALLGVIWLFSIRLISQSRYGLANVSFHEGGMVFRPNNAPDVKEYTLKWTECVETGIEKTRMSYWVYASDHALSADERREFPQNVRDGVFYFNYAYNTWEEFMKFVPGKFRAQLEKEWTEKKVK